MATEAAFKEIPEIFEVCTISDEFIDRHVTNHLPGRARGSTGGSNRKSRSVSPTLSATRLLTPVHQPPFESWALRTFAMLSRALGGLASATYVQTLPLLCVYLTSVQLGTYHFISGVDASSSASLAAYINSLTYAIEDNSAWFSQKPSWKVRNGCYWCCAFPLPTLTCSFVDGLLQLLQRFFEGRHAR